MSTPLATSFLVNNFQVFYTEVLRLKEMALRTMEQFSPLDLPKKGEAANHAPSPVPREHLTEKIQQKLRMILEKQGLSAQTQVGEFALSNFQEAQYVMIALADEVFLTLNWPEKKRWENNLLESQFYQTQIAGELIFKKIDDLLASDDPLRIDLAKVYLMALGLGFKGQYRHANDDKILNEYRRNLYTMIHRQPSNLFTVGRSQLMADCYDHLLDSIVIKGLPDVRVWAITFACVVGGYLLVSSFIWYKLARDIDSSIDYIMHQAQLMGLS